MRAKLSRTKAERKDEDDEFLGGEREKTVHLNSARSINLLQPGSDSFGHENKFKLKQLHSRLP